MTEKTSFSRPALAVLACAIALGLLHQDFWWWSDKTLVFGFLPIGLAYHAFYSVLAGLLWAAAARWAWPTHIEQWGDEAAQPEATGAADALGSEPQASIDHGGEV